MRDNINTLKLNKIGIFPGKLDPKKAPIAELEYESIDYRKLMHMVLIKRKMNTEV
jgi:hypothetical protein